MEHLTLVNTSKQLTNEVLDRAFKKSTNTEDSFKDLKVSRAAPAGEGLLSAVYRIKVTGNDRITSFIVKSLVNDALLRKTLNSEKYFNREILFFSSVLPTLIEIQITLGAKERIQNNIPICYSYHCDGLDDYILMEDLFENSYQSIGDNPTKCEIKAILKALSHLHAVSFALRLKRPEEFFKIANSLPEVYYTESNKTWYAKYLQNAIDIDKVALADFEDSSTSVYYKRFMELVAIDIYEQLMELVSNWGENPVLSHGDAWFPNFLSSKERAVMLDFQLFRCASPLTDIAYLTIMSSRNKDEFVEAVKVYYDCLVYYLNDMGIEANKVFSWEALMVELKKYGKFGLLAALTSIPLLCSERCDVLDSFETKHSGVDRIPLEELWSLTPLKSDIQKMKLVNAVRIAVDVGLI